jgi:hypothetical protein
MYSDVAERGDVAVRSEKEEEEGVGFEPTRACALAVFKTAAFDRSATPPSLVLQQLSGGCVAVYRRLLGVCYGHPGLRVRIRSASRITMSSPSLA